MAKALDTIERLLTEAEAYRIEIERLKKQLKFTIKITNRGDDYEPTSVQVLDGETDIGGGTIGGEPEDNCMVRDYRWIVPLLKKMAGHLGAEVEVVRCKSEKDEDE